MSSGQSLAEERLRLFESISTGGLLIAANSNFRTDENDKNCLLLLSDCSFSREVGHSPGNRRLFCARRKVYASKTKPAAHCSHYSVVTAV